MKKIISIVLGIMILVGASLFVYENFLNKREATATPSPQVKKDSKQVSNKFRIIAVGDSLTAGYGLNLSESYPAQLNEKLQKAGKNVEVINMGVSGETTAGLLDRVDFILSQNPEMILITIGGNDALRALPLQQTENNISKIIHAFKKKVPESKIYLANIQAPGNLGFTYTSRFNKIFKNVASEEDVNLVQFVEPEVFTKDDLMQNDGIHPNKDGYEVIVSKYIFPEVLKELK
jgi:acyl-CoA thioesterase-1